jgi:DNA helicase IV
VPNVKKQEIAAEQQLVDRVYEQLEGMRAQANALASEGHRRAAASPISGLVERDAMVHRAATQLRALDAEAEGLVFGRLDFDDGETYHIGRLGVRDGLEPLLVDWRAPAAEPFYRATSGQPLGVVRRRVIICHGPKVTDLDDDVLSPDNLGDLHVLGEGALLAALRRSRGAHMRDIVTTIQHQQDAAIRAPARGITVITGGPGTGKTQVALHRAAYLLYTDRTRLTGGRILVIGPSTVFTSYISRVLPSLGEDSVHLRALGELVDGVSATRRDRAQVAQIKGSDRMRHVLIEAMWQTPPTAPKQGYVPMLAEPLPVEQADDDPPAEDPYLHVILDEAQDLSPMECRMIARRADYASMTLVGDLGQATHPLAAGSWPQLLTRLGKREARTLQLHTGYRLPQAIADYAARILAPGITPTRSYRPGGTLSVRHVDDLPAAVRQAAQQAPRDTTIAVIATDDTAEELAAHIDVPDTAVVPASLVKGLEYDHVIVVEPSDIVAAEPRGLNRLYVALTRAVTSLVVLHQRPLPAALRQAHGARGDWPDSP